MKKLAVLLLLPVLIAGAAATYGWLEMRRPYQGYPGKLTVEIPKGLRAREVVELLRGRGVLPGSHVPLAYLAWNGSRGKLQAGEYLFDRPMTPADVLGKLIRGDVVLHRFTVPEGLTVREIAQEWKAQGFGETGEFDVAAKQAGNTPVEGYLFPETYSFPKGATAAEAVAAMLARSAAVLEELKNRIPAEQWPLDPSQTVILASLVEEEARVDDERAVIASVFMNRLRRKMRLDCDPTVVYALEQDGRYRGRLLRADLAYDSPYNTYKYGGLPPGPISNPGRESLEAAIKPQATKYLYFVSKADGRHSFSDNLTRHNRAVAEYRRKARSR